MAGRVVGGRAFTRTSLYQLLTNPLYAGRVRHKAEVFPGEHPALIDPKMFDRVQERLRHNGRQGAGPGPVGRPVALLKGLLRCGPCGAAMTPTATTKGTRTYRYYACVAGHKSGAGTCPSRPVPAGPVETFVVDRVRAAGRDPALVREVVEQAEAQRLARAAELAAEEKAATAELAGLKRQLVLESARFRPADDNAEVVQWLAALHDRQRLAEDRLRRAREQQRAVRAAAVSAADVALAADPRDGGPAAADRAADVAALLAVLPAPLQAAAAAVMAARTVAEAARDLGLTRSGLADRLRAVRGRHARPGLADYLPGRPSVDAPTAY